MGGSLHAATGGDPARSRRFRELLAPRGITDELRVVLTDGGSAWGALCLLRSGGTFASDVPAALPLPTAGVVLASRDGRVRHVGDEARALLGTGPLGELPQILQSVVARRAAGHAGSATAPTGDGRWLTFSATPLGTTSRSWWSRSDRSSSPIVVRARGLTPRERRVVEQVVCGRSNRQIATSLALSEHTVQDHLKAVFAKFDVTSRNELVAALFFPHFAPLHVADTAS